MALRTDLNKGTELDGTRPRTVLGPTWGVWAETKPRSEGGRERKKDRRERPGRGSAPAPPPLVIPSVDRSIQYPLEFNVRKHHTFLLSAMRNFLKERVSLEFGRKRKRKFFCWTKEVLRGHNSPC